MIIQRRRHARSLAHQAIIVRRNLFVCFTLIYCRSRGYIRRAVWILKYCIRVTPRILTKDPRSEADAIIDLPSGCVRNDLYTVIDPYNLNISHGCIITLLAVCCISVASSAFSTISCSEITRFRT